jgi:hypothetical protein
MAVLARTALCKSSENRDLATIERGEFLLVVVHYNDVVAEIGEASACDQAYVSRTDNRQLHESPLNSCAADEYFNSSIRQNCK